MQMTEEQYRAAEGINWSTLKHMKTSPLDYKMATLYPKEATDAMRLGSFVDCGLLTPELLEERYVQVPPIAWGNKKAKAVTVQQYLSVFGTKNPSEGFVSELSSMTKAEFEAWAYSEIAMTGKVAVPSTSTTKADRFSWDRGMKIINSNKDKPIVKSMFEQVEEVQYPLFATCPFTGLKLKGLVDCFTHSSMVDLKTIGTLGKIFYNIKAFDYVGQMAYYRYLAMINGLEKDHNYLLFVETTSPYKLKCVEIENSALDAELEAIIELLKKLKTCMEQNHFPDGSDEILKWDYRGEAYDSEDLGTPIEELQEDSL